MSLSEVHSGPLASVLGPPNPKGDIEGWNMNETLVEGEHDGLVFQTSHMAWYARERRTEIQG